HRKESRMKPSWGLRCVLSVLILLVCTTTALSQLKPANAHFTALLVATKGQQAVRAALPLRQWDTNRPNPAPSNDAGYFVVPNLPPGRYELTASYSGFAKSTQSGIVVTVGQSATVTITLNPTVEQSVDVSSATPLIEPTRTETSQVIETKQIAS